MKLPDQTILLPASNQKALVDSVLCSTTIITFAYLILLPFPLKAVAFLPLVAAAFIINRNINWPLSSPGYLSSEIFTKGNFVYILIGLQMGIIGAMYYRGSFGMPVLPATIRCFTFVAVGIAVMEELVFRGFIQGRLTKVHPGFAIVFAAFAHTTYKVFLFISPASQHLPSITLFYTWTLGAFILIGILRYYSKSIVPAIIVHVVFDLLVYAENLQAPWWVW